MNDISEKYEYEIYRLGFLIDERRLREVEEHCAEQYDITTNNAQLIGSYGSDPSFHNTYKINA